MNENKIIQKTIRVDKKETAFVKHILEWYESFATVTTIDNNEALLELSILPGFKEDVEQLIDSLKKEIEVLIVERKAAG